LEKRQRKASVKSTAGFSWNFREWTEREGKSDRRGQFGAFK
jgi:hypothetical protein